MTTHSATKESPFSLAFKMDAMVPVELNVPSTRVSTITSEQNSQLAKDELDYLKEWKRNTLLWLKHYQRKAT